MPDFAEQIGSRIRNIRHSKVMKQEELAVSVKTTRSYVSQIENGTINMRIDTLEAICKGLDIKPWELLQGIEIE